VTEKVFNQSVEEKKVETLRSVRKDRQSSARRVAPERISIDLYLKRETDRDATQVFSKKNSKKREIIRNKGERCAGASR